MLGISRREPSARLVNIAIVSAVTAWLAVGVGHLARIFEIFALILRISGRIVGIVLPAVELGTGDDGVPLPSDNWEILVARVLAAVVLTAGTLFLIRRRRIGRPMLGAMFGLHAIYVPILAALDVRARGAFSMAESVFAVNAADIAFSMLALAIALLGLRELYRERRWFRRSRRSRPADERVPTRASMRT